MQRAAGRNTPPSYKSNFQESPSSKAHRNTYSKLWTLTYPNHRHAQPLQGTWVWWNVQHTSFHSTALSLCKGPASTTKAGGRVQQEAQRPPQGQGAENSKRPSVHHEGRGPIAALWAMQDQRLRGKNIGSNRSVSKDMTLRIIIQPVDARYKGRQGAPYSEPTMPGFHIVVDLGSVW